MDIQLDKSSKTTIEIYKGTVEFDQLYTFEVTKKSNGSVSYTIKLESVEDCLFEEKMQLALQKHFEKNPI